MFCFFSKKLESSNIRKIMMPRLEVGWPIGGVGVHCPLPGLTKDMNSWSWEPFPLALGTAFRSFSTLRPTQRPPIAWLMREISFHGPLCPFEGQEISIYCGDNDWRKQSSPLHPTPPVEGVIESNRIFWMIHLTTEPGKDRDGDRK